MIDFKFIPKKELQRINIFEVSVSAFIGNADSWVTEVTYFETTKDGMNELRRFVLLLDIFMDVKDEKTAIEKAVKEFPSLFQDYSIYEDSGILNASLMEFFTSKIPIDPDTDRGDVSKFDITYYNLTGEAFEVQYTIQKEDQCL